MRQAYRIIPIYTADVSGVCSALYELGGMTVMHDPSGCNSTYNTHDEIRWYDQDSLIFISGLTDIDAIMGNDEKFLQDIEDATEELQPRFIALASSPIPFMNGTDFPGLARALTVGTGIPAFIAKHFTGAGEEKNKGESEQPIKTDDEKIPGSTGKSVKCVEIKSEMNRRKLNLLGVTPLDFGPQSIVDIMKKRLENQGWEIISTWAMGDTLETLAKAGEADVNLVVSSVGIPVANVLKEKFGTPFLVGTPVDGYVEKISDALAEMAEKVTGECRISEEIPDLWKVTPDQVIYISTEPAQPDITVIGEPVTMGSLAAAIEHKYQKKVQLLCPLEITEGLLREGDQAIRGEESIEEGLKTAKIIIADPLYRPICPETARFYELPHIAFSGRIYLRKIKEMYAHNLIKTT